MVLAVAVVALSLVTGAPADVKGKWEGTLTSQRDDGTANEDTALLILEQKDGTITGTVGGNESDQFPITSGTIDGNKISLVAKNPNNGREYQVELTVENDEMMKGTVVSGERRAELTVKKRKE